MLPPEKHNIDPLALFFKGQRQRKRLDLRRSASAGQLRSSDTLSAGQLLAANLSLNHLHPGHAAGDARPIIIVQSCCGGHSRCRF
jgi:hypothetical protein